MITQDKRAALEDAIVCGREAKRHLRVAIELLDQCQHRDLVAVAGDAAKALSRLADWLEGAELAAGL